MNQLLEPQKEANAALGQTICKALLSNGFKSAVYAATAGDAAKMALDMIPDGVSVGIPGSVTARQLGLPEKLAGKGCTVSQHWDPNLKKQDAPKRLLEENLSDWYVTSSNAVTHDGMLVNIDGSGNRVAAMAWAPGKILYIIGINKAAHDLPAAMRRARDVATSSNATRYKKSTPCTQLGHCVNCNAPDRLCRVVSILERVPSGRECHAIIVGEQLGY